VAVLAPGGVGDAGGAAGAFDVTRSRTASSSGSGVPSLVLRCCSVSMRRFAIRASRSSVNFGACSFSFAATLSLAVSGALPVARDGLGRRWLGGHVLLLADRRELLDHSLEGDPPEVEALRARDDGPGDATGFGRREHEDDVRWWLLERLQQRVERLIRELMGL